MSKVDSPETDLSNADRKFDIRKVCIYLVNSYSTSFYSSIYTIYNGFNCAKKQTFCVGVVSSSDEYINFPKRNYERIFSGKLVKELHDWIEKHNNVIQPPNVS